MAIFFAPYFCQSTSTDLVTISPHSGKPITTSLKVAAVFGKRHDNVIVEIRKLIKRGLPNFRESSYINSQNKQQPMFTMDRKGFAMLAMWFTRSYAIKLKEQYFDEFDRMEAHIRASNTALDSNVVAIDSDGGKANNPKLDSDVIIINDGKATTTSLKVAEVFGKEHKHVLRDIELLDCSEEFRKSNFGLSSYQPDNCRRSYPMYTITRDGFTFLAMGFTGPRAAQFKEQYIEAFNKMEAHIKQQVAKPAFALPTTFAAALRALADETERSEQLAITVSAQNNAISKLNDENNSLSSENNVLVLENVAYEAEGQNWRT